MRWLFLLGPCLPREIREPHILSLPHYKLEVEAEGEQTLAREVRLARHAAEVAAETLETGAPTVVVLSASPANAGQGRIVAPYGIKMTVSK